MDNGTQYIPVGDVDKRIIEIEQLLHDLPIELTALKRLRGGAVLIEGYKNDSDDVVDPVKYSTGDRLGPTDSVIAYLRRNPRKKKHEVVEAIADHVRTGAMNRTRMLNSTVYNLVRNGILNEDDEGCLTVAKGKDGGP